MADRTRTADPADPTDLAVLTALRRAWTEEDAGGPVVDEDFEDTFAAWARNERRTFFVVERDGVAIGSLNVLEYHRMPSPGQPQGRWGYLANAYVRTEHRGAGLGALLLEAALVHCAARGHARVVLSPSPRSVPFYARAGFAPASGLMILDAEALGRTRSADDDAQRCTARSASTTPRP